MLGQDRAPRLAGDFTRDGVIDIRDAYELARQRQAGDQSITQAQIDALAMQAVRLPGATP